MTTIIVLDDSKAREREVRALAFEEAAEIAESWHHMASSDARRKGHPTHGDQVAMMTAGGIADELRRAASLIRGHLMAHEREEWRWQQIPGRSRFNDTDGTSD